MKLKIDPKAMGWWFGLDSTKKIELSKKHFPTKKPLTVLRSDKLIQTIYEREFLN